ncbi:MAG: VacJ family lipoprotein [Hahellaceae bacterium]|nr:VacJ family lipoprotein [Hahellaceae bacterium]
MAGSTGGEVAELENYSPAAHERDPFENWNRKMFAFNEFLDEWLLRPTAVAYRWAVPEVADRGVTNFFANIDDVTTIFDATLQLKGHYVVVSTTRVMFNTTMGLGGFFDVATSFGLERLDEDFGQTLGYWGVPSGPYLMWPVFGPATVRHSVGRVVDAVAIPRWAEDDLTHYAVNYGLKIVDRRADLIPAEGFIVGDKYLVVRNAYLQRRDYLVNDGVVEDPFAADEPVMDDF